MTTSTDGTQTGLVGPVPYNAPTLFRRSHYLAALIALCAVSAKPLYVHGEGGFRCVRESEIGAVRPKTLAECLGVELPELAKWLGAVIADGYAVKITDPPVFLSAANGPSLILVKASCLGVAWLATWRQGVAL